MTADKDLATILAAHEKAHELGVPHPHIDEMIKRLVVERDTRELHPTLHVGIKN
jgi:hypothetical protein